MCAIFGIAGHSDAASLTCLGLHALQHRGQEGAGIALTDTERYHAIRRPGLVSEACLWKDFGDIKAHAAIGHTRYSTSGGTAECNLQPFLMRTSIGWTAIAHNGNLVNATDLVRSLEKQGSIFQSTTDTEVIVHLVARMGFPLLEAIPRALRLVEGAYSLLILNDSMLVAVRDPFGFRPLVLGRLDDSYVFASETCAFDLIGAKYLREVAPGEMVAVNIKTNELTIYHPFATHPLKRCVFEYIYFSRPDTELFGATVYDVRKNLGRQLAREHPLEVDRVIPVPDSGTTSAIGYAEELRLPFDMSIVRAHTSHRTFIQPKQNIRDLKVRMKLNVVGHVRGQRLAIIDDSLVRGTTSRKIANMLRAAGAKEVHLLISSPPTTHPCVYGIDTPTKEELIASTHDKDAVARYVGVDSLHYLSFEGLMNVASKFSGDGFCHACFTGDYPTDHRIALKVRE